VLLDEPRARSNLLYLFVISGALRGLIALFLRGRVRELRKPARKSRACARDADHGFNAMLGVIYDFIGRPSAEADERDEPGAETYRNRRAAATIRPET